MNKSSLVTGAVIIAVVAGASPFRFQKADPLKITVDGEGYLRLSREGRAVYAKSAELVVAPNGKVATPTGDAILPSIHAAVGSGLSVDLEGNVFTGGTQGKAKVGRIVLALFPEGAALTERGGVLYAASRPTLGNPGDDTNGVIRTEATKTIETKASSPIVVDAMPQPVEQKSTPAPEAPRQIGPIRIVVKAAPEIENDKVLLGDIADIEGDQVIATSLKAVEIADAPIFGAKRTIDRLRILTKLKIAGFDTSKLEIIVPASVTVSRKGQPIQHLLFIQTALKAIYESPGIVTEYTPVETTGPDFLVPSGHYAMVAETVSGVNTAVATVKIAVYVGTNRINSRTLKFNAKSLPVAIRAGSPVRVHFKAGGASVEVSGIARTAARPGDPISVDIKLPGSEKTNHSGVVLKDGSVEVKL